MAAKGNVNIIANAIKDIRDHNKVMDGSSGKTDTDAINYEAEKLGQAISDYIESITFAATPANILSAGIVAGAYPVSAASNNLVVKPIA